jgi:predicted RNA-binding Zn-ribbon protein involved in translation (DUF1610 family)
MSRKPQKPTPLALPTLAELRGESPKGVICPRCGAVQFSRVETTRPQAGGVVIRHRVCRNSACKFRWETRET